MSIHPVPDRVQEGSPNPITTMHAWRETWMRAKNDPDAFWLAEARARV